MVHIDSRNEPGAEYGEYDTSESCERPSELERNVCRVLLLCYRRRRRRHRCRCSSGGS
jgi:hypothetical protein